jgi:hypothetical protein
VHVQLRVEPPARPAGADWPTDPKFDREWVAFHDMLPDLLKTYAGQYVAIHDGRVVGHGDDGVAVALDARRRFGDVTILVHQVLEKPRVVRIGPSIRRVTPPSPSAG